MLHSAYCRILNPSDADMFSFTLASLYTIACSSCSTAISLSKERAWGAYVQLSACGVVDTRVFAHSPPIKCMVQEQPCKDAATACPHRQGEHLCVDEEGVVPAGVADVVQHGRQDHRKDFEVRELGRDAVSFQQGHEALSHVGGMRGVVVGVGPATHTLSYTSTRSHHPL